MGISIGKPIFNTQVYILDQNLNLLPVGIPGELHIGGIGLSRGYLRRDELSENKFIPNPFGEGKLYKTGDLARYLLNGEIEFLGRLDDQVKIRGFRIELGEIKNSLSQHDQIRETLVIAYEDLVEKRLVAYFVSRADDAISNQDLREFLGQKLPSYMIPSAFLQIEKFPLTTSGKIDRRALPKPSFEQINTEFVPPRTEIEVKIAEIWSQVLGIDTIGVDDNFFAVGGHSLLATQVISRLFQVFGVKLSFISFFSTPTIAGLSQEIEKLRGVSDDYEEGEI